LACISRRIDPRPFDCIGPSPSSPASRRDITCYVAPNTDRSHWLVAGGRNVGAARISRGGDRKASNAATARDKPSTASETIVVDQTKARSRARLDAKSVWRNCPVEQRRCCFRQTASIRRCASTCRRAIALCRLDAGGQLARHALSPSTPRACGATLRASGVDCSARPARPPRAGRSPRPGSGPRVCGNPSMLTFQSRS
jgi:hypothetical protein